MCFARLGGGRILRDVKPVPWFGLAFRSLVEDASSVLYVLVWFYGCTMACMFVKKRTLSG